MVICWPILNIWPKYVSPYLSYTVGENIIGASKIWNNYGGIHLFPQYCDSNIGLFSFASCKVIALNLLCFFGGSV